MPTDATSSPFHPDSPPPEPPPAWLPLRRLGLTRRESEVLWWISQGKRDREIALILGLSHRTIHCHVGSVLKKFGVETRTAALARLFELLISPEE